MRKVLVLNGPNLNRLGLRDRVVYGSGTYEELTRLISAQAVELGLVAEFFQSNHEGALIDRIQQAQAAAIIINPGALSHYSVALHDALLDFAGPVVEVHLSNIHAREDFRRRLVTAAAADGLVSGFGFDSYRLGLMAAAGLLVARETHEEPA
jgi:3-dehydroquinate dehydratase-2